MCKVMALTNISKLTNKQLIKIADLMTASEHDGFGYAVVGKLGVYGEQSVEDDFQPRYRASILELPILKKPRYNIFGKRGDTPKGPAIFHSRTATSAKGLGNCHPMVRKGHYLVHNGVVTDHGPKYKKITSNDSEDVLYRFIEGISAVEEYLSGYYAFACITPDKLLHIVRDSVATLHIAWSKELDTYIIATTPSIITETADILGCARGLSSIEAIADDIHVVFDRNQIVAQGTINPRGYTNTESRYATSSLGYGLDDTWTGEKYDYSGQVSSITEPEVNYNTALTQGYAAPFSATPSAKLSDTFEDLDDSWTIYRADGTEIDVHEFYKLDAIAQRECMLIRPDGTMVDPDDYNKVG